ncbi:NADH-quinone oxidoreductase subunit C [Streptomyces sp. NPDC000983]|uniref:NADH-quinone oxidoreductase subunit C n=1 Tax=Streptomyces sp. NPDC000983 TaxID=3154373 RepID=UPI003332B019
MTTIGWLPAPVEELFGTEATAEESYEVLTVDVPPTSWIQALRTARDELGCTYFDWLSAVDEPGTGFRVAAHVAALAPVRRLLLRTTVPHEAPVLASAVTVFAGAGWHERETHEMFGVTFEGHPGLEHLLLPETFEGHPLRKDFVLAARVAKAWPGAKEPGESDHGGPKRRQMLPPGVPDPNEWGPLKGRVPAAPARPARGAGRATGERPARGAAAGDRPVRRARSVSEGSASQSAAPEAAPAPAAEGAPPAASPRRSRSVGEGSASRRAGTEEGGAADQAGPGSGPAAPEGTGARPARRSRSVSEGSASQRTTPEAAGDTAAAPPRPPRSPDAPWHHARPAFEDQEAAPDAASQASGAAEGANTAPGPQPGRTAATTDEPGTDAPDEASGESHPEDPKPSSADPKSPSEDPENPSGGPR